MRPRTISILRGRLKNSGAGLRPAMNGRLAREMTRAVRPEGGLDACPTTFLKHVLKLFAIAVAGESALLLAPAQPEWQAGKGQPECIRVSQDGRRFVLPGSGSDFRPWGFNYDHDASNRLLETYWIQE